MTTTEPTTNESEWNPDDCTTWCADTPHNHDPACWGGETVEHEVFLSMEEGFPRQAGEHYDQHWLLKYEEDPPRLGIYAYRARPSYREVVYLHIYRPSDNEHLDLDASVHLTADEARTLAQYLLNTADMIEGAK
jgi:hypothetical protein